MSFSPLLPFLPFRFLLLIFFLPPLSPLSFVFTFSPPPPSPRLPCLSPPLPVPPLPSLYLSQSLRPEVMRLRTVVDKAVSNRETYVNKFCSNLDKDIQELGKEAKEIKNLAQVRKVKGQMHR